ncbi:retrotransposon-like family member retr-1, partial [Paramuricea clavata]
MPVSDGKMEEIRYSTKRDEELQQLQRCMKHGWPESLKETPALARCYWYWRNEITEIDRIMFKGAKIIIPKPMRQEMLMRIHTGHMGIQRFLDSATVIQHSKSIFARHGTPEVVISDNGPQDYKDFAAERDQ